MGATLVVQNGLVKPTGSRAEKRGAEAAIDAIKSPNPFA